MRLDSKRFLEDMRQGASLILDYLAAGSTCDDLIGELPDLTREQIAACLEYAGDTPESNSTATGVALLRQRRLDANEL